MMSTMQFPVLCDRRIGQEDRTLRWMPQYRCCRCLLARRNTASRSVRRQTDLHTDFRQESDQCFMLSEQTWSACLAHSAAGLRSKSANRAVNTAAELRAADLAGTAVAAADHTPAGGELAGLALQAQRLPREILIGPRITQLARDVDA